MNAWGGFCHDCCKPTGYFYCDACRAKRNRRPAVADEREKGIRARLARGTLTACRWNDGDMQFVLDALAAAREENGRLREDLLKRGRHLPGCAWLSCIEAGQKGHDAMARMVRDGCPDCDCGWDTMRAALAREDGGNA